MVILIDRDILSSFCSALGVEWEIISDAAALFFTPDGPPDFVYCSWDPGTGGAVRLEMPAFAKAAYILRITDALGSRRQQGNGVNGKEREVWKDEVTALIAMLWLLRA
jgi:hypothetical protein